jgi:hypothetical protein
VHPEHSHGPQFAGEVPGGDLPGLEPLGDVGGDVVDHEPTHGVADRALLVGEQVVDVVQREGGLGWPGHEVILRD